MDTTAAAEAPGDQRRFIFALLTAALMLSGGCAASPDLPPLPGSPCLDTGSRPNFVSGQELHEVQGANLYEVLERARPLWLMSHGSRARSLRVATEIAVIADGQYMGDVRTLRSLPAEGVHSVRYLRGNEAAIGYAGFASNRHLEAAIVVDFGCSAV